MQKLRQKMGQFSTSGELWCLTNFSQCQIQRIMHRHSYTILNISRLTISFVEEM